MASKTSNVTMSSGGVGGGGVEGGVGVGGVNVGGVNFPHQLIATPTSEQLEQHRNKDQQFQQQQQQQKLRKRSLTSEWISRVEQEEEGGRGGEQLEGQVAGKDTEDESLNISPSISSSLSDQSTSPLSSSPDPSLSSPSSTTARDRNFLKDPRHPKFHCPFSQSSSVINGNKGDKKKEFPSSSPGHSKRGSIATSTASPSRTNENSLTQNEHHPRSFFY